MSEVAGAVIVHGRSKRFGKGFGKDTPAEVCRQFNEARAVASFQGSSLETHCTQGSCLADFGGRSLKAVCSMAGALEQGVKGVASGIS